jgi:hypothetical protein
MLNAVTEGTLHLKYSVIWCPQSDLPGLDETSIEPWTGVEWTDVDP